MECFRCNGKDFDVLRPSIFGLTVFECSTCSQQFLVEQQLNLIPVELLGEFGEIEKECIIKKCTFCDTKRYIAIDCTNLNMQSCGFCDIKTKPIGDKIPLAEFIKRSSSIDGDALDS